MIKNQVAVITGGIGDIGTAICLHLCELGAKVISTYHSDKDKAHAWQLEHQKKGYDIELSYVDVTNFQSCADMAADVTKRFGPIVILVNNAGLTQDIQLRKMTEEQWDNVLRTDLYSLFNVTRHFINGMIEQNFGRVINISSINGQRGQFGQTNYTSAKAGVHGFTKSLALEVASKGITVNTISPGYIEGKMISTVSENIRTQILAQIPVGRFGKPEDVAWMVGFLASEKAAYITGANFSINGGLYIC
jgi:acetoacetyl-CoA reductase